MEPATILLTDAEKRIFEEYAISPVPLSSSNTNLQRGVRELVWTASVKSECCNRHDTLHGGVGATWLTLLTIVHARHFAQSSGEGSSSRASVDFETISYNTSLLKAVPRNSSCWIRTRIERLGKQITFTSAKLFTDEGCTQLAITAEHVLRKYGTTGTHFSRPAKL